MDGENFMENPYFFNGWFGGKHTIFGNNHMDVIGCVWLGLWTDQWWTDQSVFSPILINEVFCWSYNPLILIFDPNFLGHPSIQLGVFCRKNLGGKDKGFKLSWYIGHQHPWKLDDILLMEKIRHHLWCPKCCFYSSVKTFSGIPKWCRIFSINRIDTREDSSIDVSWSPACFEVGPADQWGRDLDRKNQAFPCLNLATCWWFRNFAPPRMYKNLVMGSSTNLNWWRISAINSSTWLFAGPIGQALQVSMWSTIVKEST